MTSREKMTLISEYLTSRYPDAKCGLNAGDDPFRLLVMAILSAQCTDVRVNLVSGPLFERFPDVYAFAAAEPAEIEGYIRSCGMCRTKALHIRNCARILIEKHGGTVPQDIKDLDALPGVGRKIANLIRGDAFGLGGIVADTHCIRLAFRWGLTSVCDPKNTEEALDPLVPKDQQSDFCHRVVQFGRDVCTARYPKCDECGLRDLCNGV